MSVTPLKQTTPDIQRDANILQHQATEPNTPVWVGASAGSGKTTVLVNRLLRLMLPNENGIASDPSRILCTTFTKAGASEVMERVVRVLRQWAIDTDEDLNKKVETLLQAKPNDAQIKRARSLFARVIETPGGMKIMTIHAFCQSVLARFPMEAGLPAGFEVMTESESRQRLRDVRRNLIARFELNKTEDKDLKAAFELLSTLRNADQIEDLMERMMAERGRLRALLTRHNTIEGLEAAIYKALKATPGTTKQSLLDEFISNINEDDIRHLSTRLGQDNKTNIKKAESIALFLSTDDQTQVFDHYKSAFLTKTEGTIAKPTGLLKDDASLLNIYTNEGERLQKLDTDLCDLATAESTATLMRFSAAVLDLYEAEKNKQNQLDFEDLIDRTRRLLSAGGVNWVQYKLDGGIDHILVDEAQDTNPDQWDIITALYDEFYDGTGAREPLTRTTFVVGDEKQSIFSFQRADPRVFDAQHDRLEHRTADAQMSLRTVPMRISFRSAPSILQMVDAVFEPIEMRQGVLQNPAEPMHHDAMRTGKAGHVELWPLIKRAEKQPREAWALPLKADSAENPITQMAEQIAKKIRALLDDPKEILESKARRIRAGDIMILLSKRPPLAEAVLKALRDQNIPVNGIDRMVVTKQLAVRDALAAIAFTLQPGDDLNLAALLKSPFIGMNEDQLFNLANGRGKRTLWQTLKERNDVTAKWLSSLLEREGGHVASFLHCLLYTSCPADNRSGMRALMQRLGEDVRDPIQELLARADLFDMTDTRGLQGFLQDAQDDESELKRDQQDSADRVRVMTVHGSKGLEAPIVFMPDTIRSTTRATTNDAIFWPDRTDTNGVPLWVGSADTAADLYTQRKADYKTRENEEYRRLLYVALTRAADRLYISGVQKSDDGRTDRDNSWYFACEAGIQKVGHEENGIWILKNRQTDPVKAETETAATKAENTNLPNWMLSPAPTPESPPRPLMPSKPENDDPAVMSPLFGDISHRYKRGLIIHTLFQFLPDLDKNIRRDRAAEWLKQPAHSLKTSEQEEILTAVFNVLDSKDFETLFTAQAKAEVPLTGHIKKPDGTHAIVSGQIDRLLVDGDTVTVLDYKTNRPAPKSTEDVPEAYRKQLRTYRDLLVSIWPDKSIRCALLWTDGPALMDVTDTL